jgi:N-acetylneuraminic acid mutarotase
LKEDGSIAVWGDSTRGGSGAPSGTGYVNIFSNYYAFVAVKDDTSSTYSASLQDTDSFFNDVWELDLTQPSPTWSLLNDGIGANHHTPEQRHGHSCIVYNDTVVIFGGYDGSKKNDTWAYDLTTNTWNKLTTSGTPPNPRAYHSVVLYGDKMVVFGGSNKNDVWTFELTNLMEKKQ